MLSKMEQAALDHAAAELKYRKSPQAKIDATNDKNRRAKADKIMGHSPNCSLTKCACDCPSHKGGK